MRKFVIIPWTFLCNRTVPSDQKGRLFDHASHHPDSWSGCQFGRAEKLRRLANHHIITMGTIVPFPAMQLLRPSSIIIHHVSRNNTSATTLAAKNIVPHAYVTRTSRPRALSNSDFSTSSLRMLSDTELLRTADIPDGAKALAEAARARKRVADSIFILVDILLGNYIGLGE